MFKSIIVGTNGTEKDLAVVGHAAALAKIAGATLHIAHGFKPVTSIAAGIADSAPGAASVDFQALDEAIQAENENAFASARAIACEVGVSVTEHSLGGEPADMLIELARNLGADLIVIGNHGMHTKKRFFQGSVANRVVHRATCSVLVVDVETRA